MIIRMVSQKTYNELAGQLAKKARFEPLSASCTVDMAVNGKEYVVRLQPEKRRRIAVLEALELERIGGCVNHTLVTKRTVLSALLELLVHQGV